MAYGHKNSYAACNAAAGAHGALCNSGYIRLFTGTPPTEADDSLSGNTQLAQLTFGATAFGAASNGVITANAITQDSSADADGTAAFGRTYQSNGTTCVDQGLCGTSASDYILSRLDIQSGGVVSCSALTRTYPRHA